MSAASIRRLARRHERELRQAELAGMADALSDEERRTMRAYNPQPCNERPARHLPTAGEVATMADAVAATRDEAADMQQAGHDPALRAWVARHVHIMDMEP